MRGLPLTILLVALLLAAPAPSWSQTDIMTVQAQGLQLGMSLEQANSVTNNVLMEDLSARTVDYRIYRPDTRSHIDFGLKLWFTNAYNPRLYQIVLSRNFPNLLDTHSLMVAYGEKFGEHDDLCTQKLENGDLTVLLWGANILSCAPGLPVSVSSNAYIQVSIEHRLLTNGKKSTDIVMTLRNGSLPLEQQTIVAEQRATRQFPEITEKSIEEKEITEQAVKKPATPKTVAMAQTIEPKPAVPIKPFVSVPVAKPEPVTQKPVAATPEPAPKPVLVADAAPVKAKEPVKAPEKPIQAAHVSPAQPTPPTPAPKIIKAPKIIEAPKPAATPKEPVQVATVSPAKPASTPKVPKVIEVPKAPTAAKAETTVPARSVTPVKQVQTQVPQAAPSPAPADPETFVVQLGSYSHADLARDTADQYQRKGTPVALVKLYDARHTLWHVLQTGPFPTRAAAQEMAQDISKNLGVPCLVKHLPAELVAERTYYHTEEATPIQLAQAEPLVKQTPQAKPAPAPSQTDKAVPAKTQPLLTTASIKPEPLVVEQTTRTPVTRRGDMHPDLERTLETMPHQPGDDVYMVQVGAFHTREYAQNYINYYRNKGYPASSITINDATAPWHYVFIGLFHDYDQAKQFGEAFYSQQLDDFCITDVKASLFIRQFDIPIAGQMVAKSNTIPLIAGL